MKVPASRSRRARFAGGLDTLGALDRLLWIRGRLGLGLLTVLTQHRVARPNEIGDLDPGVVEVTPEDLATQLEIVKAHCSVVSLDDVRLSRSGRRLPPNPVLLTFDDGYRDNYDVALPILTRAGVPATFFIPTAFPDGARLFWWDRIALVVARARNAQIELTYPVRLVLDLGSGREAAARTLAAIVKHTQGLDLDRMLDELETAAGYTLAHEEERAIARRTIMSWDLVRSARRSGIDIASHSHAHRVLGTLSLAEEARDLRRSRRELERELGEAPYAIAYPVGHTPSAAHLEMVRGEGFTLGFTNGTGLATRRSDPLALPRVSVDRVHTGALYKLVLLLGERTITPRSLAHLPRPNAPSFPRIIGEALSEKRVDA